VQTESIVKKPTLAIIMVLVCYVHVIAIVQASTNIQKVFCAVNAFLIILSYISLLHWASGKKKFVLRAFILFALYEIGEQTAYFFARPLSAVEAPINGFTVFIAITFLILLFFKKYQLIFPVLCVLIGCLFVISILGVLTVFSGAEIGVLIIMIMVELIGRIIICYPYLKIGRKLQQFQL